ncbi:MAG: NAD(+) diphosphatase [Geminicoccaceae bacterium]|nr:NAD(+) diphosphatase [Geminicoccaceae bacterium]MCX7629904.1 NAD(+) diphosphatase [Geminicoccaceae bacterium]MDW8124647.1 NAD(+) diphosphatase [Geminicoccaceae bacterium]MDW8342542.1 NAD(+) diphosphatase [Geminicoccaceae bacterium]
MPIPANPPPHVYTTIGLERAADRRRDGAWLARRRRDPESLVVALGGLRVLIADRPQGPDPFALDLRALGGEIPEEAIFLGLLDGRAVFALDLGDEVPGAEVRPVELRALAPLLPARELGLLAYARALLHWAGMQRFCGRCGSTLRVAEAGHLRRCPGCAAEFFPRTDPAVIVLVTAGEHCVLGRSPRFPPGVYSTLAGFVEPGESLEAAVAREIREEVGLELEELVYRSSQPWPFPQSLMLGFRARARFSPLRIDADELEDARWFHRRELLDEGRRPVRLPAADSIARYLIEEWLFEGG